MSDLRHCGKSRRVTTDSCNKKSAHCNLSLRLHMSGAAQASRTTGRTLARLRQSAIISTHPLTQLARHGGRVMALAINDTAPDFEAQTTEGKIRFHDWIGNSWV